MIIYSFFVSLFLATARASDGLPPNLSTSSVVPTYITLAATPHDYNRFSDGGPDANWYIGFNSAWIVKLPPAPYGDFARAFIGAKIGRAKTRPVTSKPWQHESIPGRIYIGISQTSSWNSEQGFFLAETKDIPAEADPQARVDGIGAGEWFWAEVPLANISFTAPNYVAVWSPTSYFVRAASSPILAAADLDDAGQEPRAWINHSIMGVPPRNAATSLETPLNTLAPALAIKLVPPGPEEPAVVVSDLTVSRIGKKIIVRFSAAGEDIVESWVEVSRDQLEWQRLGRIQRRPPYLFSFSTDDNIPAGSYLRGAARDISNAVGQSDPYMIPYAPRQ